MCERLKLVTPNNENSFPTFKKWKLRYMHDVLTKTAIKDIPPSKVKDQPIKPIALEKLFLSGEDGLLLEGESSEEDVADENKSESEDTVKRNSIGSTKRITSSTNSRRGNEGLSKRSPTSVNVTPIRHQGLP